MGSETYVLCLTTLRQAHHIFLVYVARGRAATEKSVIGERVAGRQRSALRVVVDRIAPHIRVILPVFYAWSLAAATESH